MIMKKLAVLCAAMMVSAFVFAADAGSTSSSTSNSKMDANTQSQQACDPSDKTCDSVSTQANTSS